MRSAQRSRSIFVLFAAIGAVLCALAVTHSTALPAAAAETPQAPHASVPANDCTSSISIASFSINKNRVAAGETLSATLGVVNGSRFSSYTHYYEVVVLDADGDEVQGTRVGTNNTVPKRPFTGNPRTTTSIYSITVPEGIPNGPYLVRVNVRTQDGGQICLIDTTGFTVNTPVPEPDPESCDNENVQITRLSFPPSTRQGNGIIGHIRVRNTSDQTWTTAFIVEILDPDETTVFRDTWTATLSPTNREANQYPSWTTATSNQVGTYTVHASVRSGGEVCHATFASGTRTYTIFPMETFELTDSNSPPTPTLLSPANLSSNDDATPTLEWEDVDDPEGSRVSYALQVSTDSGFRRNIVISRTGLVSNEYPIDSALSPGRYYWRVRSSDSEGNSNNRWSVGNFRVTAPPAVTNSPPTIKSFSPRSTSLTVEEGNTGWEFSATGTDTDNNLSGYQWFLDDQPVTTPGNLSSASGSTEFVRRLSQDFANFEPGSYPVRVTFTDAAGESVSRTWNVTVPGQALPPEPPTPPTPTTEGNPWDDGTELIYESNEVSSLGLGPVNLPDTEVFVGVKPPDSGELVSTLKIRLERRQIALESANDFSRQLSLELGRLLGIPEDELQDLNLNVLVRRVVLLAIERVAERSDTPIELPGFAQGYLEGDYDLQKAAENLGLNRATFTLLTTPGTIMARTINPVLGPVAVELITGETSPEMTLAIDFASKEVLKVAFYQLSKQILPAGATESARQDFSELMADWVVKGQVSEGQITSELRRLGVDYTDVLGDMVDLILTSSSTLPLSSSIPGFGAIAALLLLDSGLGFDGEGHITVAVPRTAWIEHWNSTLLVKRWWGDGPTGYDYRALGDNENKTYLTAGLAGELLVDFGINSILSAIGAVPVLGDVVQYAMLVALDAAEIGSDIVHIWNDEQRGPEKTYLSPRSHNCTNRISVPWDLGIGNTRGIELNIPVALSDGDYIGVYADFTRTATSRVILDVNWPFIRERGEFEVGGEYRAGQPLQIREPVPPCDPSQLAPPSPSTGSGIVVSPAVVTVPEGGTASYTVRLNSDPGDTRVTVRTSGNAGSDLLMMITPMTFDSTNWNEPRTVPIRARQDNDSVTDAAIELVHTAFDRNNTELDRENVVVVIDEDDAPQAQPSGPRWLSSSTEVAPRTGSGGRLEVRVLTLDTTSNPSIAIDGPGLSRTRLAGSCSLQHRPPGYVVGVTRCWDAVVTLPVNDTGSTRTYTVKAESPDIAEDLVTDVAVSPTPGPDPAPVPQPGATTTVAVATGLAPLGDNLQWVLRFDNATQQWQSHSPVAPSAGTLTELVPGQIYWIGVNADQTAVLGGVSRTLIAGLNQVLW